ncbi:PP2C family protein-serine/threonine phosphatase [Leptospira idonii]|uniref:GAF domain-containing protein n=1 Tax=Leptospira idonii TaxID=1193500 RepID=A0A4R9LYD7_9LEPT|nr:GAF domain-containing SpoIIE family protein phosphatase [Leptospira idonii]TGN19320.1 GAF domain-containing protein [Leptospira idonii]
MESAKKPENEKVRLKELKSLDILDSVSEKDFDDITQIASHIMGTPIALISLIDEDRQWFKSRVGLPTQETHRDLAFCAHAILEPDHLLTVPDTSLDRRFFDNPLVTGEPNIKFYMGAPLVTKQGNAIGTLCVIDRVARTIDPEKEEMLRVLAKQVVTQIELRALNRKYEIENRLLIEAKHDLQKFHKRISADLETAREIQNSLIPKEFPKFNKIKIHTKYLPIEEVGGDSIGFYEGDDYLDFLFADVSGHGISAAFISAMSIKVFESVASKKLDLLSSLQEIHSRMKTIREIEYFLSCCYIRIFLKGNTIRYAFGGHHPILILRKSELIELGGQGNILFTSLPVNSEEKEFFLEQGDRLILVSDGFFDIFNRDLEQLGWARLKEWILTMHNFNTQNLISQLTENVKLHSNHFKSDDMTLLCIQF